MDPLPGISYAEDLSAARIVNDHWPIVLPFRLSLKGDACHAVSLPPSASTKSFLFCNGARLDPRCPYGGILRKSVYGSVS